MKKRFYIIIGILVLLIISIITYILLTKERIETINYKKGNFYELKINTEDIIDNQILVNNELLKEYLNEEELTNYNFDNHNYALVQIEMNSCGERNLKPKGYLIEDNILTIHFTYEATCGVCPREYEYYLLELNKDINDKEIKVTYESTNKPHCDPTVAYKPIIYIYPEEKKEIEIKLSNEESLLFTYPKYNNKWNITVETDGTIISNNKKYYALFWEGKNKYTSLKEEGFVVKGKEIEEFLEEKLTILGLNYKERNEFIIYWLPKLEQNTYNYIYFESLEEINNYMSLEITPKPDNIIRIQMDYKPLDKEIKVKEQILTTPSREGYTVVEWGGSLIK